MCHVAFQDVSYSRYVLYSMLVQGVNVLTKEDGIDLAFPFLLVPWYSSVYTHYHYKYVLSFKFINLRLFFFNSTIHSPG